MIQNREEYKERKELAMKQMVKDFLWLLEQPPGKYEWLASKKWLIEWANDVGGYQCPNDGEEGVQTLTDELLRPLPVCRLYELCFGVLDMSLPRHPSASLSKLREQEKRRDVSPDYVILYYMKHLEEQERSPLCHIIERLLRMK